MKKSQDQQRESSHKITATRGTPQSAKVSTPKEFIQFPSELEVLVTDNDDKPVRGVEVKLTAPDTGASAVFPSGEISLSVYTNDKGVAVSPKLRSNGEAGKYEVIAEIEGGSVQFELENLA